MICKWCGEVIHKNAWNQTWVHSANDQVSYAYSFCLYALDGEPLVLAGTPMAYPEES